MKFISHLSWPPDLTDPIGKRENKPRKTGKTMVIDKGIGIHAFRDALNTVGDFMDLIKIGFGTSCLYPLEILQQKIALAQQHNISVFPGGTFLEVAIFKNAVPAYFEMIQELGFDGIEVSDGTIEFSLEQRQELILKGLERGLNVYTEVGKKLSSEFMVEDAVETVNHDLALGAQLVILEGRESGNAGVYKLNGECRDKEIDQIITTVKEPDKLMWEAPLKSQQIRFIQKFGSNISLGNIASDEILSLEALRRGLRSDTFPL